MREEALEENVGRRLEIRYARPMATLPLTVSSPVRARGRRILRIEVNADRFERLAADFGLFNPDFLESVERAEADARAGRVREISSLRELQRPRRR